MRHNRIKGKRLSLIITLLILCCVFAGCAKEQEIQTVVQPVTLQEQDEVQAVVKEEVAAVQPIATPQPTPTPTPAFVERDITLMAVGDNLMHMGVVYTGRMQDDTYDYSFLFEDISGFLEKADIKIINQETILGGNELGFSGYPYFNSPTEVGDAIATAGFNVVLQASNHAADQGLRGLKSCAVYWEQYPDILMTGIYEETPNSEEADKRPIPILTIDEVTFAVLNYTYGPNMEVLPRELQGHLNMLCAWDENSGAIDFTTIHPDVLTEIEEASRQADVVIVCPHWGTEYTTEPSVYQKEFAKQMAQAGADLIIGTHPHVVQPVEWVEGENGNRALCYYSLGNYVSTQKNALSMLEAMAWVTFRVKENGVEIVADKSGVFPMVCQYTSGPVRTEGVYLLEEYTQEMADNHGIRNYGNVNLRLEDLQAWSDEILGEWILSVK